MSSKRKRRQVPAIDYKNPRRVSSSKSVVPVTLEERVEVYAAYHVKECPSPYNIPKLNDNDVVCWEEGKDIGYDIIYGGLPGNVKYRKVVAKERYNCDFEVPQNVVETAGRVVSRIRAMEPPGRFVQQGENKLWFDVGNVVAVTKAYHALTEAMEEEEEKEEEEEEEEGSSKGKEGDVAETKAEEPNNVSVEKSEAKVAVQITNTRQDDVWAAHFSQLQAYKSQHGHPNVPKVKGNPNYKLSCWLSNQRRTFKEGKLSPERTEKLILLGCSGFGRERKGGQPARKRVCLPWEVRFQELETYKDEMGNANPTKGTTSVLFHRLANWLTYQRQLFQKGTLGAERIQKLRDLGCEGFEEGAQCDAVGSAEDMDGHEKENEEGSASEPNQIASSETHKLEKKYSDEQIMEASKAAAKGIFSEQMENEIRALLDLGTQVKVLYAMFPPLLVYRVVMENKQIRESNVLKLKAAVADVRAGDCGSDTAGPKPKKIFSDAQVNQLNHTTGQPNIQELLQADKDYAQSNATLPSKESCPQPVGSAVSPLVKPRVIAPDYFAPPKESCSVPVGPSKDQQSQHRASFSSEKKHHQSSPKDGSVADASGVILEPNVNDVLCGRGNYANAWPGNVHFRNLVRWKKEEYSLQQWTTKQGVSKQIVDQIKNMNPPGRFLRELKPKNADPAKSQWVDVGEAQALKKTSQALREKEKQLETQMVETMRHIA